MICRVHAGGATEDTEDTEINTEKCGRVKATEEKVIVELKAIETISSLHVAQSISYLKMTKKRLALIINFNVKKLVDGIRRIAL